MKAKISSTVFGGAFKNISNDAVIDMQKNEIVLPDGVLLEIKSVLSPLYKLRGKDFYRAAAKLFFIPLGFSALLLFWSLNLLIFGDVNIFLKIFLLISPISVFYYLYEVIIAAERRSWIQDIKKKILLIPFAILFIGALASFISVIPGFVVSALLFSALAAFFIEEYAIRDLKWMMSEGVSFWVASLKDAPDQEKKVRYQNIDSFLLAIEAKKEYK